MEIEFLEWNSSSVGAAFWFLSSKGRKIQAQSAQHNEFVESELKN